MTYKQMTKEIEQIPKQIAYLYNVRDTHYKGNKEIADMTCDIVNNLCAYQNYLKFDKEYKDKTLADMELRQCKREASKQEIKHGHWVKSETDRHYCSICHESRPYYFKETLVNRYAEQKKPSLINWECPYCPNCGAKMDGKENDE